MNSVMRFLILAGLAAFGLHPVPAESQQQTVRIVFPYPPGGSADAIVRLIAEQLQTSLGRTFIVENKTGAGGRIGAQAVKAASPDGSMLLFAAATQFTLQPHVLTDLGYDPLTDFVPLARVVAFDQALVIAGHVPAQTLGELVSWLRNNPDQAVYGSPGAGTGAHFVGLEFGRTFGIAMRHVPYRGTPAALPDLIAGRLPIYVASLGELIEYHDKGSLRILATAGGERSPIVPGVATLKESGVNIEAPGWFAFYATGGTPKALTDRLEKEIAAAASMPAVRARIEALGFRATDLTSESLRRVQRIQLDMWATVVKATGYKPE